jgi:hypothetical protein
MRDAKDFITALQKTADDLEHYSPADIRFSREQMIWLIEWLDVLEDGKWPPDPKETGYIDTPGGSGNKSSRSPFETAAQIFAEVTDRLKQTGEAGVTLVWEIQHGLEVYELLSPPAKRALNYISGWRRRRMDFSSWMRQNRYRGNEVK